MSWRNMKSFVQKFWLWLCRQWAEAEAMQGRLDAERLKIQERNGFQIRDRWL